MEKIPDFCYNEQNYVMTAQTWEEFRRHSTLSEFDKILSSRWQNAMENNVFNYYFSEETQQKRIIKGNQNYIVIVSVERFTKRRLPQVIESVNQPFNSEKFNFTKIKKAEILMNFCIQDNDFKQVAGHAHKIIINNSPFAFGHCLLLPNVADCIPQKLTLQGIKLSIDMILLSSHPGFRIGFSSLCAMASVNHQHLHGWYINHQLRVEYAPVDQLAGICYQQVNMPSRGFVFQLHGNTVHDLARAVFTVGNYLQTNAVAHNMFLTRGTVFGEEKSSSNTTVRVYIWPRKHYIRQKNVVGKTLFHVGVAELAGQILLPTTERFDDLTEAEIIREIKQAMLPEDEYKQICDDIKLLISGQGKTE